MKLKFDSTLSYQLEAIKSVTDLFEGQPARSSGFHISPHLLLLLALFQQNISI